MALVKNVLKVFKQSFCKLSHCLRSYKMRLSPYLLLYSSAYTDMSLDIPTIFAFTRHHQTLSTNVMFIQLRLIRYEYYNGVG